jgi:hypothetical protein
MSTLLTRGPVARDTGEGDWPPHDDTSGRRSDDLAGRRLHDLAGPTLDDVISRAWEVLRADVPAACPACGGELLPRESAGAGIVGGRCESCGTTLT